MFAALLEAVSNRSDLIWQFVKVMTPEYLKNSQRPQAVISRQAIAAFGKFVAEAKFQKEPERFAKLIKAEDRQGIDEAITNAAVEQKVLERLRLKAKTYGTDPDLAADGVSKVNADAVVAMYKDWVIPLTKEVEVEYLMERLKGTQWE